MLKTNWEHSLKLQNRHAIRHAPKVHDEVPTTRQLISDPSKRQLKAKVNTTPNKQHDAQEQPQISEAESPSLAELAAETNSLSDPDYSTVEVSSPASYTRTRV